MLAHNGLTSVRGARYLLSVQHSILDIFTDVAPPYRQHHDLSNTYYSTIHPFTFPNCSWCYVKYIIPYSNM